MTTVFDTLQLVRNLRDKAGFSQTVAEGISDSLAQAMQGDLATKADLTSEVGVLRTEVQALRSEVKAEIADLQSEVKAEIAALRSEVKAEIAALRSDMKDMETRLDAKIDRLEIRVDAKLEALKSELIRWMFGAIGFQTVLIVGTAITLAKIFVR